MKILFIASEVAPFAKSGGLADVTGSLPQELSRMGHDVRIIMPFYKTVAKGGFLVRKIRKSVDVAFDDTVQKGLLRRTLLSGVPVYLLENKEYFFRDHLYGVPEKDYPDNPRRFAFFCRGVLEILKRMDYRPDVLHCHDWQTALIPLLLKYEYSDDPFFSGMAVIFTIHNLAYQGLFPAESLAALGLDSSNFTIDRLEYYDQVNLMKGGILTADLVNTVSETYCHEILTAEHGCGLEGVLSSRKEYLSGIVNGIDYTEWNPATDREIFKRYSASSLTGKAANKKGLQALLGMEQDPSIPLVGMVSRMIDQKGFDLVGRLLPVFAGERMQLAVIGSGEETYARMFQKIIAKGAKNISFYNGFDTTLARRVYAGSDIFLMPSRFEPCGLGQLIALRYGAVPVVRSTGGLADTVVDEGVAGIEQSGFVFSEYAESSLLSALRRAFNAHKDGDRWKRIVRSAMTRDFSWKHSAQAYQELYREGMLMKGFRHG
jgi:starch synthase